MTYSKESLNQILSKKLDPETRAVLEGMLANAVDVTDTLADHEDSVIEELIAQKGGVDLARFKIQTLIDRMKECDLDNPNVGSDYRDFRLAQSALDDLLTH